MSSENPGIIYNLRCQNNTNLFRSSDYLIIYICYTHHISNIDIKEFQKYSADYVKPYVVAGMSNMGAVIHSGTT